MSYQHNSRTYSSAAPVVGICNLSTIDTGLSDGDGILAVPRTTGDDLELATQRMQGVRVGRVWAGSWSDLGTFFYTAHWNEYNERMLGSFLFKTDRQATEGTRSTERDGTARVECGEQRGERRSVCGRVKYHTSQGQVCCWL